MKTRRTAFTLVELLVVISIIALLVSILLPALNKARDAAKFVICATNQHQLGASLVQYADDNKGRIAPGSHRDGIVLYNTWQEPAGTAGPMNLGHLLAGEYIPLPSNDNSVIYDPGVRRNTSFANIAQYRTYNSASGLFEGDFYHNWEQGLYYVLGHYDYRDSMDGVGGQGRLLESQKGASAAKISKYPVNACLFAQGVTGVFHAGKYNITLGDGSVHLFGDYKASLMEQFFRDNSSTGVDDSVFYRYLDDFFGVPRWRPIDDGYPRSDPSDFGSNDDPPLW